LAEKRWKELVDTMSDVSDDGETSSIADSPTRSETSSSFSSTVTQSNKPAKKRIKSSSSSNGETRAKIYSQQ